MKNLNPVVIGFRLLSTFIVFVVISFVLQGAPMFMHNLLWAVAFSIILTYRDTLSEAKQRMCNMIAFGLAVALIVFDMAVHARTPGDLTLDAVVGLACAYYFYRSYSKKV